MNAQCNSCGGFMDITSCQTCFALICARCQTNHEQGCSQAAEMKRKGQGPTIHQVDAFESTRPNPVVSVNDKVVTDGPAWYGLFVTPELAAAAQEMLTDYADAVTGALQSPAVVEQFAEQGLQPTAIIVPVEPVIDPAAAPEVDLAKEIANACGE